MQSTLREYFESLVVTVILALFGTTFIVQAYKIPTPSMEDNLLVGDHLLVNKFLFGRPDAWLCRILPFREVRHGDVIVFKYPEDLSKSYVKRAIGLPGDRIRIITRNCTSTESCWKNLTFFTRTSATLAFLSATTSRSPNNS